MKTLNPEDFKTECTTVWSFPKRGDWATHNPKYRGNFAPQVARNLIESYTKEEDFVLDPMVGSGTTLIEAKLLNRNALGIDINPEAIELTRKALDFEYTNAAKQKVAVGDARNLSILKDDSVDLIVFHPPYLNIVQYSDGKIKEDLSNITNIDLFCDELEVIIKELYRVLKPNKYCGILIGDTRKAQHYIPLSYYVFQRFLNVRFALKEEIIKSQHNCIYSRKWEKSAKKYGFYLIMHEHLFVFRKPEKNENLSRIKWSMKIKG
ncbi:MAG TPA: RNA methyltransferase [Ignavibacteriales bacterium]|nr:RNA methyltransferase [Ignavibacteriales bacterium]